MNLSIKKTKVVAAVAATLVALMLPAIAQAQDEVEATAPSAYGPTGNSLPDNVSPQRVKKTSPYTDSATVTFSDGSVQGPRGPNGKNKRIFKSTKNRSQDARLDHSQDD